MKDWSIQGIWEQMFISRRKDRAREPVIWSSELGRGYYERYLKMKGIPESNPPDLRTQRVFMAGNIFEYIIKLVFKNAGILLDSQKRYEIALADCLPIVGKCDIVGGIADWGIAVKEAENIKEEWLKEMTLNLIEILKSKYPDGLEPIIYEVKTVHSNSFHYASFPYEHHKLQLYTYMIANEIYKGRLLYISKDDLCIEECGLTKNQDILDTIKNDARTMTHYFKNNIEPPKPEYIIYDEKKKNYRANWEVAYSRYLTYMTGYKDKDEFNREIKNQIIEIKKRGN